MRSAARRAKRTSQRASSDPNRGCSGCVLHRGMSASTRNVCLSCERKILPAASMTCLLLPCPALPVDRAIFTEPRTGRVKVLILESDRCSAVLSLSMGDLEQVNLPMWQCVSAVCLCVCMCEHDVYVEGVGVYVGVCVCWVCACLYTCGYTYKCVCT